MEARAIRQAAAEIAGGTLDMHVDRMREANADVVARIGVQHLDVDAVRAILAQQLVGFADGRYAEIDRCHVS